MSTRYMQLRKRELDALLVSTDPDVAGAFYRDALGFAQVADCCGRGGLRLQCFRIGNHCLRIGALADRGEQGEGGVTGANGIRLLSFVVDDLAQVLSRLDAHGTAHRELPVPERAPFRIELATDPDGNELELIGLRHPAGEALTSRMQIGLTVADVAAARTFYGVSLGLKEEPTMPMPGELGVRYAFTAGNTTIKFWSPPGKRPTHSGPPELRTGIRCISIAVADIRETERVLAGRGVQIVVPPERHECCIVAYATDPDGNWLEFSQPLQPQA